MSIMTHHTRLLTINWSEETPPLAYTFYACSNEIMNALKRK
jgi:hypothetical protein